MKHEAEEELIKTLNGQISELPSVAKTMVQQYQMSAIVLSVLYGVLFVATTVGTIWLTVFFYKKNEQSTKWATKLTDDYGFAACMTALVGGTISAFMLGALILNLVHACAPIASIVSDLLS